MANGEQRIRRSRRERYAVRSKTDWLLDGFLAMVPLLSSDLSLFSISYSLQGICSSAGPPLHNRPSAMGHVMAAFAYTMESASREAAHGPWLI